MSGFGLIVFVNAAALLTLVGTGVLRRYALHANLLDLANERSSHSVPTPRGGGASIVVVTLVGMAASPSLFGVDPAVVAGLCGGGALVALIGWLDDHGHVPAGIRLLCHVLAAIWLIGWVGALPVTSLLLPDWASNGRGADYLLSGLFICWMINLFNFMDGLDGLAAGQAWAVTAGGLLLLIATGAGIAYWVPALLLAAAVAGFLPWNWPPARIFMGDASSGFLGFMLASLAMVAGRANPQVGFAWAILPGVFVADATVTMLMRLLRRQRIYEAHRSHAYQRLARRIGDHLPVTVTLNAVTLIWLFPVAYLVATNVIGVVAGAVVAMMPLVLAAFFMRAGRE